MKYQKEFEEKFKNKNFTTRDITIFLNSKNAPKTYTSLFLNNNMKNNKIFRIKNGSYSFSQNIENIEKTFSPSYHGLQDALTIQGLWQQQTNPILITPRKIRTGERTIFGTKIIIRRINRKMFFGYEEKKYFDKWITISDIEKTLVDFAYYNEPLDKETMATIKKQINKTKLSNYLKRIDKKTAKKVKRFIQNNKEQEGGPIRE